MKVMFKLWIISAVLTALFFGSNVFAQSVAQSNDGAVQQTSGKSAMLVASLDDSNAKRCHMVEETPSCVGMAPQKSQTVDHAIRPSLSSSALRTSETTRTFINEK